MTQLDRLRSMPLEEVAKGRIRYKDYCCGDYAYKGDFGEIPFHTDAGGCDIQLGQKSREAYAEAMRLEIAWLESETEGEK